LSRPGVEALQCSDAVEEFSKIFEVFVVYFLILNRSRTGNLTVEAKRSCRCRDGAAAEAALHVMA